jgi:hypothetical protein
MEIHFSGNYDVARARNLWALERQQLNQLGEQQRWRKAIGQRHIKEDNPSGIALFEIVLVFGRLDRCKTLRIRLHSIASTSPYENPPNRLLAARLLYL